MPLKKEFEDDEKGFIFTVDGTLAVLISILGLAAVLAVGSPTAGYRQHGYRRLGDYANDALQVMEVGETINEIEEFLENDEITGTKTKNLARNKLLEILPDEIQFRMVIGPESNPLLENIYPAPGESSSWESEYENTEDVASAVRMSYIDNEFEPIILYVWRGDGL